MTSGSLLYDTGSRMSVFCENLEGWGGEGGGREVQEGRDIYIPMVFEWGTCSLVAVSLNRAQGS